MAGETKERILNTALALFSQRGYLGTSMSDIANELGMTKGALYKHYTSKQEILDRITARMGELDQERAKAYQMPDAEPDGFAEAYQNTPAEKIRTYSVAQFRHWTENGFSARFRKLLTLRAVPGPRLCRAVSKLPGLRAGGVHGRDFSVPMTDSNESTMQLALEF
ncbi:MAG: TetR/AcrR family transcriptional regulator [Evtepia sp.]